MLRVLFLDIDGVLNSAQSFIYNNRQNLLGFTEVPTHKSLCPIATSNLEYILEELPDVLIVITSTQRKFNTLEEIKGRLVSRNVCSDKVVGVTPALDRYRGIEIESYLKDHPEVTKFVIVDDDTDMDPYANRLVKTDGRIGLTFVDAERIIEMLGGKCEES